MLSRSVSLVCSVLCGPLTGLRPFEGFSARSVCRTGFSGFSERVECFPGLVGTSIVCLHDLTFGLSCCGFLFAAVDPTALERGAKALKELDSSPNAMKAFEITKLQESTRQKELELELQQVY